jgi:hypothetical protein
MPRALFVSFAIVAAFQLHPAAASTVEDAPITPSVAALAARLGLEIARDRARFMSDIARLLYAASDARPPELTASRPAAGAAGTNGSPPLVVPVPMPAASWSRAVFRRTVPPDQLVSTILGDRRASLLCRGLAGLDDETLTYFIDHPALVTMLYERAPGAFAAFSGVLRIRDGRVATPGGPDADPLWEAVVRAPVSAPDQFVRALFDENEGRVAYLYETIDAASPSSARFALGSWIADATQRTQRFRALAAACVGGYREWRPGDHPFSRPLGDLAVLLLRIRLEPSGMPAAPSSRAFWAAALDVDASVSESSDTPLIGGAQGPIDAAWIVGATSGSDMYTRTDRLYQFAFGQRVFRDVSDEGSAQAAQALRGFRQNRMLMLTIERMGIHSPSAYLAALQRAAALVSSGSGRRFWILAQFQGALALLARTERAGTISSTAASRLLLSLCAVPLHDAEYDGGVAQWMSAEMQRALPREGTWEERTIAALAGSSDEANAPRLFWEGQAYRLDLAHAERDRLAIVRDKQGGHTLDLAMAIDAIARQTQAPALTVEGAQRAARDAQAIASESAERLKRPAVNLLPPSVDLPRDGLEWLNEAANDLAKITRPVDLRRAPRVGASLHQLADLVLGDALLSLAYAADLGDPDGAALLAGNVSLRHDFGFGRKDGESRTRTPWLLPRQDFQPGVPWHITGSVLGLNIALAPMSLRRLTIDRIADAPKLSSIEREALAVGVGLLDVSRLTDGDRDAIASAIDHGRDRIRALLDGTEPLEPLADALGFDGWRRRAISWFLEHEPQSVAQQFSLVDLLTLGGGATGADLDAWGTSAIQTDGCACTEMPSPRAWRILNGRPQLPMMASTMGDFNLAVALVLRDLKLPAGLVRPILTVAMQDFIDDAEPATSTDWWSLSRVAQSLKRQRVEDYVSVAAAVDGPLVPEEPGSSREH